MSEKCPTGYTIEAHAIDGCNCVSQMNNQRQIQLVVARAAQFTGRRYPKLEAELSKLSVEALTDLVRLINDGQQEVTRAKNQAIHQPWRR